MLLHRMRYCVHAHPCSPARVPHLRKLYTYSMALLTSIGVQVVREASAVLLMRLVMYSGWPKAGTRARLSAMVLQNACRAGAERLAVGGWRLAV